MTRAWSDPVGPYRADQIREGDPYELSQGHRIDCMTAGGRHGTAHLIGSSVINSDPGLVHAPGVDVGIEFNEGKNLRAPDISAGLDLRAPGWAKQAPPLAIEFADGGQDETQLRQKISELLEFGTRLIWVVRLTGPLRVEIHEPNSPVRVVHSDGELHAPGILQNSVPVRALIDRDTALDATFRNLLGREGYASLEAVREEGRALGLAEGREEGREAGQRETRAHALATVRDALHAQLETRGFTLSPALAARLDACTDLATLTRWLTRSVVSTSPEAALD